MGTIRFELRTDKPDKEGLFPLELIYSISGQRKKYSPGIKLYKEYWDRDNQEIIYLDKRTAKKHLPNIDFDKLPISSEVTEMNNRLSQLRNDIAAIEKRFELDKIIYSSEMVIDTIKQRRGPVIKKEQDGGILFNFIDHYIETHKATREPGSLSVYRSLKAHLEAFQKETGKKVTFNSINYNFFQAYQNFLIERRGLNNTTVAKQLSTVKTFLNYAKLQGLDVPEKYKDFKIKKETLEVIALTNDEFETLYKMDLSNNKKLDQVRDVFCFACVTGLRYSDLDQLKREHIKEDEIIITIKKTKERLSIPLTSFSKTILAKYKHQIRPLPVISNQKMNDYLKGWDEKDKSGMIIKSHPGICEIAGINEQIEIVRFRGAKRETNVYPKYKLIGVHTGRKTFATLSLEKGMSAEEVMTITGHKDYKSFKRYVKVTEQRKKVVMLKAWEGGIKDSKLRAV